MDSQYVRLTDTRPVADLAFTITAPLKHHWLSFTIKGLKRGCIQTSFGGQSPTIFNEDDSVSVRVNPKDIVTAHYMSVEFRHYYGGVDTDGDGDIDTILGNGGPIEILDIKLEVEVDA